MYVVVYDKLVIGSPGCEITW